MSDQQFDIPPGRFAKDFLHQNPKAPLLRHFIPVTEAGAKIPRDRFGNRVIASQASSYFDREGTETKAGLLMSIEGEEFIKSNRGILSDIDKGVHTIIQGEKEGSSGSSVNLDHGGNLTVFSPDTSPKQSKHFILDLKGEKYLVKIKNREQNYDDSDITQPFVNEMLQGQSIGTDHFINERLCYI